MEWRLQGRGEEPACSGVRADRVQSRGEWISEGGGAGGEFEMRGTTFVLRVSHLSVYFFRFIHPSTHFSSFMASFQLTLHINHHQFTKLLHQDVVSFFPFLLLLF